MKLQTIKPRLASAPSRLAQAVSADSWRAGKEGSTARGYGYRWQQARIRHLARHPLCSMCDAAGRVVLATVVDHKEPHKGDPALFWNESNWDSLCAHHHSSDKQRMEASSGG